MFKFLKEKLQKTLSKFSKEVESKSEEVTTEAKIEETITEAKPIEIKPQKIKRDKSKKLFKPFEQITKEI